MSVSVISGTSAADSSAASDLKYAAMDVLVCRA